MRIQHTGITVKNIDKAVEFYRDVIGLKLSVAPTEPAGGDDLSAGVGVPGACLRQALLRRTTAVLNFLNTKPRRRR